MDNSTAQDKNYTALILAASRKGPTDAVAQIQNKSHKCLVTLNGVAMIERVISSVINTKNISKVYVSIDNPEVLREISAVSAWIDNKTISVISSKNNLAESVIAAADMINSPFPLIITAGDNALHTPDLLDFFCEKVSEGGGDTYIAMTSAEEILKKYPDGARAFHHFKDGAFSSCNLYAVATEEGLRGAKPFATGGQFGKKPYRIALGFGLLSLILYKLRALSLRGVADRISKAIKAKTEIILIPWAEGPIDVDNANDYKLVSKILVDRERDKA
jgi:GTP:adenosylcobinamide-phosphate guanylyltransferase